MLVVILLFFFCLKLCYICCVVYVKLYFFVFLMIYKVIFKINENRCGLVDGGYIVFYLFGIICILFFLFLLRYFYGRCFGFFFGLFYLFGEFFCSK